MRTGKEFICKCPEVLVTQVTEVNNITFLASGLQASNLANLFANCNPVFRQEHKSIDHLEIITNWQGKFASVLGSHLHILFCLLTCKSKIILKWSDRRNVTQVKKKNNKNRKNLI